MKKITFLIASLVLVFGAYAQTNEIAPNLVKTSSNYDKALWTIQLDTDPTTIGISLAGVAWTGTEFWCAKWNSDTIYTANATGALTGNFTISGISGARSITTDGTDMYIGNAATNIYQVSKSTKTILSTISTAVPNCRYLTYDPTLNGNAGGFWTGQYGSDITAVDMTGGTLNVISAATHGLTGIYGMAYDSYSTGGPFLWAFDQGGNGADIVQLNMTGAPTGVTHDATLDLAGGNTGIAGGLFITNNFVSGTSSMIGINQGASLFAYELTSTVGVNEITNSANLSVYPNPTNSVSTITFNLTETSSVNMEVINSVGELVYSNGTNTMTAGINKINFDGTELPNGIYFVNLTIGDQIITKKISLLK